MHPFVLLPDGYAVARWGASTSVFSWDLWNEASAAEGYNPAIAARWHQRMARYLRSVDETKHVIHTNFGNLNGCVAQRAISITG